MSELWDLVQGKPEVDPVALAQAIEKQAACEEIDFRTRLLIRDSTCALEEYWGRARLLDWLSKSPVRARIESIQQDDLGKSGFPTLKERLMEKIPPDLINEYLRDLGSHVEKPATLIIGGSIALILGGYLARSTEDIDLVDEIPLSIRSEHALLDRLKKRYGIYLAHFQSHYLPSGWEQRLKDKGRFGSLNVFLVDAYDILIGKLVSAREKDIDDLRAAKGKISKNNLAERFTASTASFLSEPELEKNARRNWYILFGEEIPVVPR